MEPIGHKTMFLIFLILILEHRVYCNENCYGINCGSGTCVITTNPSLPYYCKCSNGVNTILPCPYENPCSKNPCHPGTCELVPNILYGYLCRCAGDIISLTDCNVTFQHCASNPCVHGSCVEGIQSFTCNCLPSWTGKTCAEPVQVTCSNNPCGMGRCFEINDSAVPFVCLCSNGKFGISCPEATRNLSTLTTRLLSKIKHSVDKCNPLIADSCANDGKCLPTMNGYQCLCTFSFTGRFCEIKIDPCLSNPCLHGGVCFSLPSSYICGCRDGSFRSQCLSLEEESDLAQRIHCPCQNGGECTMISSQPCICQHGFTGHYCESTIPIDNCGQIHCVNGGSCFENVLGLPASVYCVCRSGYTGKYCEIEYFQCQGNGRFPDQYNCDKGKYFECIHYDNDGPNEYGLLLSRSCPETLRYNAVIDRCDYAANIPCF